MPKIRVGLGIEQRSIYPHFVARPSTASFEHVARAQLADDLLGVDCPDRAPASWRGRGKSVKMSVRPTPQTGISTRGGPLAVAGRSEVLRSAIWYSKIGISAEMPLTCS